MPRACKRAARPRCALPGRFPATISPPSSKSDEKDERQPTMQPPTDLYARPTPRAPEDKKPEQVEQSSSSARPPRIRALLPPADQKIDG